MTRLNHASRVLSRQLERAERQAQRRSGAPAPPGAMKAYRARVAALTDCHRIAYSPMDWSSVAARGEIERPLRANLNELAARRALVAYRPTLMDRLFGLEQEKRRELAMRVAQEASKDEAAYRAACKIATEHNAEVQFAVRMVKLEIPALNKALADHGTVDDIGPAIEGFELVVPAKGRLKVVISGLELDDMPDERCEPQDDGSMVFKPLPTVVRNTLHRANLCAAALRVGTEVLSIAPVAFVDLVVECDVPDAETGEPARLPVLQLRLTHRALTETALSTADPVEAFTAFGGKMEWSAAGGVSALPPGDMGEFAAA
jgi:hypothetical protein